MCSKDEILHNGFRAIAITDDIAGNKGPLFSYDYFVDTICPVYKGIAGIIKKKDYAGCRR